MIPLGESDGWTGMQGGLMQMVDSLLSYAFSTNPLSTVRARGHEIPASRGARCANRVQTGRLPASCRGSALPPTHTNSRREPLCDSLLLLKLTSLFNTTRGRKLKWCIFEPHFCYLMSPFLCLCTGSHSNTKGKRTSKLCIYSLKTREFLRENSLI